MLGNGRLEAYCFDGKTRLCHIRGKMRKKIWVNQSDIILIELRSYQDEKADVIVRYDAEEARALKKLGALPSNTQIEDHEVDDQENTFEFVAGSDADDSSEGEILQQSNNIGMLPPSDSEEYSDIDVDEL